MTIVKVIIWDEIAGYLVQNDDTGDISFQYDEDFLLKGLEISPFHLPLENAINGTNDFSFPRLDNKTFKRLPGMISDSLPDAFGTRIINHWLERQGRTPQSFSTLERLCYVGKRGMGALEYEPAIEKQLEKSEEVEIEQLMKKVQEIFTKHDGFETGMKEEFPLLDILKVATSAGGARPKAIIAINAKSGKIRSGQVMAPKGFEYYLLKFDGINNEHEFVDPKGSGRIEYAYSQMVKDCGIEMSETKLLKENERAHFMTKRFDRVHGEKLHMQTLCGIAHYDRDERWSYEEAFGVLRRLRLGNQESRQLFKRMVFNIIARNQDDHTKNISFLMDKTGNWTLSPAYDMTYSYDPTGKWTRQHQMSLNGKRDKFERKDFENIAKHNNIKDYKEIIEQINEVVNNWTRYANDSGVYPEHIKMISKAHRTKI
ncbi:MAG: type II toxin-antitoxin system HipA family toxin [Bacteroidales bacterium]